MSFVEGNTDLFTPVVYIRNLDLLLQCFAVVKLKVRGQFREQFRGQF